MDFPLGSRSFPTSWHPCWLLVERWTLTKSVSGSRFRSPFEEHRALQRWEAQWLLSPWSLCVSSAGLAPEEPLLRVAALRAPQRRAWTFWVTTEVARWRLQLTSLPASGMPREAFGSTARQCPIQACGVSPCLAGTQGDPDAHFWSSFSL